MLQKRVQRKFATNVPFRTNRNGWERNGTQGHLGLGIAEGSTRRTPVAIGEIYRYTAHHQNHQEHHCPENPAQAVKNEDTNNISVLLININ